MLFLNGDIKFTQIHDIVLNNLSAHSVIITPTIGDTVDAANWAAETTLARYNSSTILS